MNTEPNPVQRRLDRALKLVERLMALSTDQGLRLRAVQIQDRLKLPMSDVLAKVPGDNVGEKVAAIGITRQAYHQWLHGVSRPSMRHAKKLAALTGYDATAIRGRTPARPTR